MDEMTQEKLECLMELVRQNGIKAVYPISRIDTIISLSFMEVRGTSDTVFFGITVVKNGSKKTALMPDNFAKLMNHFESFLDKVEPIDNHNPLMYNSLAREINNKYYELTKCHRIFFVHKSSVPELLKFVTNKSTSYTLKNCGVSRLYCYIKMQDYDFKIVSDC